MADCCYKLLSVMKNGLLILLKIPADQDNAMENAIRALFHKYFTGSADDTCSKNIKIS
jgi:hypothetical protein